MDLVSTAIAIAVIDAASVDLQMISERLRLVTRLIRMAQGEEITCNLRLDDLVTTDPSICPEHVHAVAAGRSLDAANRSISRAKTAHTLPLLRTAIASGDMSAEHLDAFSRAIRSLPKGLRPRLIELQAEFVRHALVLTVEELRDRLVAAARQIEGDDGASRFHRHDRRTHPSSQPARAHACRVRPWRPAPDRSLIVRRHGEVIMSTGPPSTQWA